MLQTSVINDGVFVSFFSVATRNSLNPVVPKETTVKVTGGVIGGGGSLHLTPDFGLSRRSSATSVSLRRGLFFWWIFSKYLLSFKCSEMSTE